MDQQLESQINTTKPEWALTRRERKRQALLAAGIEPRKFPWFWAAAVVVVGAGIIFVAIPQLTKTEASAPEATEVTVEPVKRILGIDVTTIAPQTITETIKATGSMAPRRTITLTSQVNGPVDEVNYRVGDTVKAGDVLVQVDVETLNIQLQQQRSTAEATRAQLVQAQSQVDRTLRLLERGLVPSANLDSEQASVDALRSNLSALEAQVSAAEVGLRNATVVAPFDGVVASRAIEPGQVTSPGATLMQIVDLSVMEMTAYVSVSASPGLNRGQSVTLTVEGLPGQKFEGSVTGVSPIAQQGTRTVPVLISVQNPNALLRGGMFATGQIVVQEVDDALAVPPAAVRKDAEGDYVLKVVDGVLARQAVEPGRSWRAARVTQIASGVSPGDVVISGRLDDLKAGMDVLVVEK